MSSESRYRTSRRMTGWDVQTEPTEGKNESKKQGRKEMRRCRGSARGDVPGEGRVG